MSLSIASYDLRGSGLCLKVVFSDGKVSATADTATMAPVSCFSHLSGAVVPVLGGSRSESEAVRSTTLAKGVPVRSSGP